MERLVSFKTNARHISQLGRELVTDFVTALVELVKNSYDADANGVKIIFDNVKQPNGKIILIDTGIGMTQNDIDEKWTVIGTNNKVRTSYSPKGRKYAGKKGIGRFAVERLAERITIYSFTENEKCFKFNVNWNKYEEINIQALKQRITLLRHDYKDIGSAKYIKSHIDYFFNNDSVKDEHKNYIKNEFLEGKQLEYNIFLNNNEIIDKMEEELIPIFALYQNEEVRISDINNKINDLSYEEESEFRTLLDEYYKEINIESNFKTGLIMVLDDLRDEWKQRDITKLQKELRVLVSPDFLDSDPFKVKLIAHEFELQSDIIMNNILDLSYAKIKASITSRGKCIKINYSNSSGKDESYVEEFKEALLCGDLNLELYYFVRDQQNLSDATFNVVHARQVLDEFCGIKIYRDGFRVKPYGDIGNDWLLLDKMKIKETHDYRVGNNQVIGILKITEEDNPLLVDATNREGIIENEAYEDLKKFVITCTNYISNIRYQEYQKKTEEDKLRREEERKRQEDEKRRQEEKEREEIHKKLLDRSKDEINNLVNNLESEEKAKEVKDIALKIQSNTTEEVLFYKQRLDEERKRNDEFHQKAKQIFDEAIQDKESELNLYKNLATLGILTGAFGHETKDVISRATNNIGFTKMCYPEDALDSDIESAYELIEKDFYRIQGYSSLIVSFLKKKKREKYEFLNVKEVIEDISKLYQSMLITQKIDLELNLSDFMSEVKMLRIDLESIVINMITNSYEALKTKDERKIRISSKLYDAYYELVFEDNGIGVKRGSENQVFLPFKTTKEDGIGLGLSIVKDIVDRYKGQISVINSLEHGGAVFTIKFPRGE